MYIHIGLLLTIVIVIPSIPARQAYELRCRALTECSPNEQKNLNTLFTESQFNEKCLANRTKLTKSSLPFLYMSTLHQLI
ncbi:unnamed protein product [Rotaria sp. Silwood2]|nr:unnamed protein product [Rotaria sp. Silwood2]CAF2963169.1 unnamed protein product [Rotaria sp. Silwood2]CAF4603144.1 unnamed protein product [Rotaria sp. Silwood2]